MKLSDVGGRRYLARDLKPNSYIYFREKICRIIRLTKIYHKTRVALVILTVEIDGKEETHSLDSRTYILRFWKKDLGEYLGVKL